MTRYEVIAANPLQRFLAERGYDRLYGARPLGRVIQEHIKKALAEELLFGKLVKGGAVKVTLKDNKLDFEITEAALPARISSPSLSRTQASDICVTAAPSRSLAPRCCARAMRKRAAHGGYKTASRGTSRPPANPSRKFGSASYSWWASITSIASPRCW